MSKTVFRISYCSLLYTSYFFQILFNQFIMLARIVTPSTTILPVQNLTSIYFINSRRNTSHTSNELDPYRARYERLWRQKATLDWLPKAQGDWHEVHGKKQTYYNKILLTGIISLVLSLIYLRTVIIKDQVH
ncbi:hypothetical protein I4U23_001921 [Adineta vaga]|nr:hypothetical protein I4U23_001921 [Adineta vaga]